MKRRRRRNFKRIARIKKVILFLEIITAIVFLSTIVWIKMSENHFVYNTYVEGVNCSFLTPSQASNKIEEELRKRTFVIQFDNMQYVFTYDNFDFQLINSSMLNRILLFQDDFNFKRKDYSLENTLSFSINEESLRRYLKMIDELKEENMVEPKNAFLQFDENSLLEVVPEQYGTYIDFENAYESVKSAILHCKSSIDFYEISRIEPTILSTDSDLLNRQSTINAILETKINFELSDGSIYTLDKSIIKDWVYKTNDGSYQIDMEDKVTEFVHSLSQKVNELNSVAKFNATDIGEITIVMQDDEKVLVDEEAEVNQIMQELGTAQTINRSPIYDRKLLPDVLSTYIELDITRQTVWVYVDGECVLSTPCVTGNAIGHNTPVGIYYLKSKSKNAVLRGYNDNGTRYASHVKYWMPFNGGIGFHDASWRDEFGGEIYKTNGSHGCVNLPLEAAKTLYELIDSTIPIIVYNS